MTDRKHEPVAEKKLMNDKTISKKKSVESKESCMLPKTTGRGPLPMYQILDIKV